MKSFATLLLFAAATTTSLLCDMASVAAAERQGDYRSGVYRSGTTSLRTFAFTYTGELTATNVKKELARVFATLQKDDVSAKLMPISAGRKRHDPVALAVGDVFVIGYVDTATRHTGWLAIDRANDEAYPDHHWLTSGGNRGLIKSIGQENTAVQRTYRPAGKGEPVLHLAFFASAGWMRWAIDWRVDPVDLLAN